MFVFRRPVPAVEEEREQTEFELDVKFLRERQRREFRFVEELHENFVYFFFAFQGNSIG